MLQYVYFSAIAELRKDLMLVSRMEVFMISAPTKMVTGRFMLCIWL